MLRSPRVRPNCQTDEREEGRKKLSVASAQHSRAAHTSLHGAAQENRNQRRAGRHSTRPGNAQQPRMEQFEDAPGVREEDDFSDKMNEMNATN